MSSVKISRPAGTNEVSRIRAERKQVAQHTNAGFVRNAYERIFDIRFRYFRYATKARVTELCRQQATQML